MIRKIAVTTAAVATSIILAATGAGAAPGSYIPGGSQNLQPGTGSSTGTFTSDQNGRLTANSSAIGGNGRGGLLGGGTKISKGSAAANVKDSFFVDQGRYRVTVTYSGVQTSESATGNGTSDTVSDVSIFFSPAYFQGRVVATDRDPLDSGGTTVSSTIELSFTKGGTITVTGEIEANSTAKGNGNSAATSASTTSVAFTVQKIG